ncbi:MAG TPA: 30S ribosomal protein S3, partial [Methanomassiliicoccaceae archaeon]|nr:30S ribosomal protein S3 [Methanomassiliicoccaceae archaeon]
HIVIAGKLTGQRHRTEKFKDGYIKFCGETKITNMDRGYAVAKLKPGVIGVTVEIMHPDAKLPDEIEITTPSEAAEKFPDLAELINKKEAPIVAVEVKEKVEEPSEEPVEEPLEEPVEEKEAEQEEQPDEASEASKGTEEGEQ